MVCEVRASQMTGDLRPNIVNEAGFRRVRRGRGLS